MNCGAGFGSPEGEPGEGGQEGHGSARTPRGRHAAEKPEWRHTPVRGSGGVASLPVHAFSATGKFPI